MADKSGGSNMPEEQIMSSMWRLASKPRGSLCLRSLLATATLFGLSVAAYGDTINTINSGSDPFVTYTTAGFATDCGVGCVNAGADGPTFAADTDEQNYSFSLSGNYEAYIYTSGFFYGGFQPTLSLFYSATPAPIVDSSPDYSNFVLLAADNVGGPACNLPTAAGAPLGAVDRGVISNGACVDSDLSGVYGPGSYLLVLTEYGNIAQGPFYAQGNAYSGYVDNIPGGGTGGPNFTSDSQGPCPNDGNTPFLNQNSCVAAANGGNWVTTIDVLSTPEPEPGVLVIIGTLLIFGSRRFYSVRNRQEKKK
jgi:hypothetical protein